LPINFHVAVIKDGIVHIINGLQDDRAKSPGGRGYFVSLSLGFQGAPLGSPQKARPRLRCWATYFEVPP